MDRKLIGCQVVDWNLLDQDSLLWPAFAKFWVP